MNVSCDLGTHLPVERDRNLETQDPVQGSDRGTAGVQRQRRGASLEASAAVLRYLDNAEHESTDIDRRVDKLNQRAAALVSGDFTIACPEPLRFSRGCAVTLEQDRAEIERVAVSWQDVPEPEQEAMLASLGKMLEYLDSSEDAEYQLRLDAERLITKIEAGLGR